jgi:hypothetical protein
MVGALVEVDLDFPITDLMTFGSLADSAVLSCSFANVRLAIHWPALGFVCSVNGEMGDFSSIIVTLEGQTRDLHSRQIAQVLRKWATGPASDRPVQIGSGCSLESSGDAFRCALRRDFWFYFRTRGDGAVSLTVQIVARDAAQ